MKKKNCRSFSAFDSIFLFICSFVADDRRHFSLLPLIHCFCTCSNSNLIWSGLQCWIGVMCAVDLIMNCQGTGRSLHATQKKQYRKNNFCAPRTNWIYLDFIEYLRNCTIIGANILSRASKKASPINSLAQPLPIWNSLHFDRPF